MCNTPEIKNIKKYSLSSKNLALINLNKIEFVDSKKFYKKKNSQGDINNISKEDKYYSILKYLEIKSNNIIM